MATQTGNSAVGGAGVAGGAGTYAAAGGGTAAIAAPVVDLTTGAFIPAGVASGAATCTAAANAGAAASLGAGAATIGLAAGIALAATVGFGALIGVLKTVLGPYRLASSISLSIGGLPTMKQLSWAGALKQLEGNIAGGVKQAFQLIGSLPGSLIKDLNNLGKKLSAGGGVASGLNILSTSTASTRINPFGDILYNDQNACAYFSTATSATTYLSYVTATTEVGALWYDIQQNMASTASGSYQSIFFTAKIFTDQLCSVPTSVSLGPIMTIEEIIKDSQQVSSSSFSSVILATPPPSLENFASTLYYPYYINSATSALASVIAGASTSTTTYAILKSSKDDLDLYTTNLLNQITSDITNQSNYMNQGSQVNNITVAANTYNSIKNSESNYVTTLYQSTIHPGAFDTINLLSSIQDLSSANTQTVINAIQHLSTAT